MLIIRGVNVFPSQIETVLMEQGYPANYQIVVDRVNHSDTLEVLVEMAPDKFSDSLADIHEQDMTYLATCREMGRAAAEFYGWTIINCVQDGAMRSIEDIHEEIYRHVQNSLEE